MERNGKQTTDIFDEIKLDLSEIDLGPATEIVISGYHNAGYSGGEFENAKFIADDDKIILDAPEYTRFMLFGRGPGKMPPIEPIAGWCAKMGIDVSPWAIAKSIAKKGTKGNNFLTPLVPDIAAYFAEQISAIIGKQIVGE